MHYFLSAVRCQANAKDGRDDGQDGMPDPKFHKYVGGRGTVLCKPFCQTLAGKQGVSQRGHGPGGGQQDDQPHASQ